MRGEVNRRAPLLRAGKRLLGYLRPSWTLQSRQAFEVANTDLDGRMRKKPHEECAKPTYVLLKNCVRHVDTGAIN